jgi:hypothetical protein
METVYFTCVLIVSCGLDLNKVSLHRNPLCKHDAMDNAPGYIECDQDDDEPKEEWFVVLEGEKAQRDSRKDTCPDEKLRQLDAAASQEDLLDKTVQITRIE